MAGMPDPLTDLPPPSRFDPDELNAFAASDVQPSPPLIVVSFPSPTHPFSFYLSFGAFSCVFCVVIAYI